VYGKPREVFIQEISEITFSAVLSCYISLFLSRSEAHIENNDVSRAALRGDITPRVPCRWPAYRIRWAHDQHCVETGEDMQCVGLWRICRIKRQSFRNLEVSMLKMSMSGHWTSYYKRIRELCA
jgi:hypothetical protein